MKPCSAWATTKRALGFGCASFASSRQWTPLKRRVEAAPARDAVDVGRDLASPAARAARSQVERERLARPRRRRRSPTSRGRSSAPSPRGGPATSRSGTGRAAAGPGRSPPRRPSARPSIGTAARVPRLMSVADRYGHGSPPRPRALRRASPGPTPSDYLQRMVSNDVDARAARSCDALLLTPKARLIAPLRVWRRGRRRLPAADRARARRGRARDAAPRALRGEVRDRAEEHTSSSCFGERRRGCRRRATASRRRGARRGLEPTTSATTSSSALRIEAGVPALGHARSTTRSCRPRPGSTRRTSRSRRAATRARSRSRGCTTAATRTAACACSSSTAASCRRTTRDLARREGVGRVTSAVPGRRARLRPRRGAGRRRAARRQVARSLTARLD